MTNQCTLIRIRIGSWNVPTLFQKGKLAQLNIMTTDGKMFLYPGMLNEEDPHVLGVGILFNKDTKYALLEWNPVSETK
jgi:hypothetical protein